MQIKTSYIFKNQSPADVWAALFDTAVLSGGIPGCLALATIEPERRYRLLLRPAARILDAPDLTIDLTFDDMVARDGWRMNVTGHSDADNTVINGNGTIKLVPDGDDVQVTCTFDGEIEGASAKVGQSLLETQARALVRTAFAAVDRSLTVAPEPFPAVPPDDTVRSGWQVVLLGVGTLAALTAVVVWFIRRRAA